MRKSRNLACQLAIIMRKAAHGKMGVSGGPRFGVILDVVALREVTRRAKTAERAGFDLACYYDHTLFWNVRLENVFEVWTTLAAIAKETSKIKLIPLVTDALRRHPSITAQALLTLDQISNGRAGLGLGAGSAINLDPFGIQWNMPLSRLREAIQVIKLLCTASPNAPANFKGKFYRLEDAFLQLHGVQTPSPPIYQSSFGPLSRRCAGEVADGFVTEHESPRTLRENLKDVEAGAKIVGRELEDVEVLLHVDTAVSIDLEAARRAVEAPLKRDIASEPFQRKRLGIKDDSPEFKTLDDYRRKGMKGMSHERLLTTVDEACNQIPSAGLHDLAISGSTDDCIDKIEEYVRTGATTIIVENCGPDVLETERAYEEKILPYFLEQRSR